MSDDETNGPFTDFGRIARTVLLFAMALCHCPSLSRIGPSDTPGTIHQDVLCLADHGQHGLCDWVSGSRLA